MFYRLTHPEYVKHYALLDARWNPIYEDGVWNIPSVICPTCGRWGSSDRLRGPPPDALVQEEFRGYPVLDLDEWLARRPVWAAVLGVPEGDIRPGAVLGPPRGALQRARIPGDSVHPFPGMVWVKRHVAEWFRSQGFSGVRLVQVDVVRSERVRADTQLPELWELYALGKAWRVGMTLEEITLCGLCGRRQFPSPGMLTVDESRWDGSDFFCVDGNPNIVLVTERVRDAVVQQGFSNVEFLAVD